MKLVIVLLAALAAEPRLDWLAGYWLSCEGGRQVSETWSAAGGVLLGSGLTLSADGRSSWEQLRISPTEDGGVALFATPEGQQPTAFRLVRSGEAEAVFENPDHDFPQRVIYRREGEALTGRIEGRINGRERAIEWVYRAAPLNARCE